MTRALHATVVAIRGRGVLVVGPPGSGKSDLALRLIDRGALLVADDRVTARATPEGLLLSPPESIAGLIEVRGLGIVRLPFVRAVPAALLVDLASPPERLPEPVTRLVETVALPVLFLAPFAASAPLKVELALALPRAGP